MTNKLKEQLKRERHGSDYYNGGYITETNRGVLGQLVLVL